MNVERSAFSQPKKSRREFLEFVVLGIGTGGMGYAVKEKIQAVRAENEAFNASERFYATDNFRGKDAMKKVLIEPEIAVTIAQRDVYEGGNIMLEEFELKPEQIGLIDTVGNKTIEAVNANNNSFKGFLTALPALGIAAFQSLKGLGPNKSS